MCPKRLKNDSKIDPERSPKGAKILNEIYIRFYKFVYRFWEPKWSQNGARRGVKPHPGVFPLRLPLLLIYINFDFPYGLAKRACNFRSL